MRTFLEYLTEAYTPISREKFTVKQLKEIGDFLAKSYGIGVEASDVQHWKAKDFRLKMAVPNGVAVCKLKDGNYVILSVYSQQRAVIAKNTSPIQYETYKEVIYDSTDVFTLNVADHVNNKRNKRQYIQQINDPLIKNNTELKRKIAEYGQKKSSSSDTQLKQGYLYYNNANDEKYTNQLLKELNSCNCGIKFNSILKTKIQSTYNVIVEYEQSRTKQKYVEVLIRPQSSGQSLEFSIRMLSSEFKSNNDFAVCNTELLNAKKLFNYIEAIDYAKLPSADYVDYLRAKTNH